jgi:Tfp pilus assembly protein PilO
VNIVGLLAKLTMLRALILGLFFASIYYFFVYDSGVAQQNQIESMQKEFVTLQAQIKSADAKLEHAHEYQRSAAEMGEALNRLLAYIPENYRLPDFMKVISEEAKVAGLNILRVSEGGSTTRTNKLVEFEELAVAVDLSGSFSQHLTFLSNLTKQKQIFTVEKYQLDRESSPGSDPLEGVSLNFKAEIRAYRYIGAKQK